jgi:2-polyprenyl-6-methoxyphenol hydroxylase-like FAD-dependent oxidoreductase
MTCGFLGMIEEAFLRDMERNGLRATRSFSFKSYTIDSNSNDSNFNNDHPVTVELTKGPTTEGGKDGGEVTTVKCKYLVGCDGGRSAVRQFGIENHGLSFDGELLSTLWGAGDFGEWQPALLKWDSGVHRADDGIPRSFSRQDRFPRYSKDRSDPQRQVSDH